jgi:hypothetical protein
VVVQSLEDLINAFFAGVMEVARIVDVVCQINGETTAGQQAIIHQLCDCQQSL